MCWVEVISIYFGESCDNNDHWMTFQGCDNIVNKQT